MVRTALHLQGIALNAEASAPDWVQLVPAGPRIMGRDGRWWMMSDPQAVADRFDPTKEPQIDIEHSSEIKAPMGEPAPAVGWIKGIEVRDGALWGRVEWTPAGSEIVATRAYRYLSPVFTYDMATGEIGRIVSVGLTNQPNLEMAALNRAEEENPMDRAVLEALGLPAAATAQDALIAINAIKSERDTARNSAHVPDPAKFVPVADHQLALNRIQAFETAEAARRNAEIETAVDAAIAAGKVAPASKDFHVAACRAEGGFDRFKAFIGTAPVIAPASGLDGKAPEGVVANAETLTAEELAVCRMFGSDPASFIAAKKQEK